MNKAPAQSALWCLMVSCLLCNFPALAAPFAYVPLGEKNEVVVIDTATNSIVARLAGNYPYSIAIAEQVGRVYVSNALANTISVFNMVSHELEATIETIGISPVSMVADPSGTRVYVMTAVFVGSEIKGTIEVIDTRTNTLSGDPIDAGHIAYDFAIHPTGRFLYSTGVLDLEDEEEKFFVIDTGTRSLIAQVSINHPSFGYLHVEDLVIDPVDGDRVYVAHDDELTVIDTSTNTISTRLSMSLPVYGLTINPTGSRLYAIGAAVQDEIYVIDTSSNELVGEINWQSLFSDKPGDTYDDLFPRYLSIDAAGRLLFVLAGNPWSNPIELAIVDAISHTLVAIFPLSSLESSVRSRLGDFVQHPDRDGDGLLDSWESVGIDYNADGVIDFKPAEADPNHKDLYAEIDWMEMHEPDGQAIKNIINSFEAAPLLSVKNPDGNPGVRLHVDLDEQALAHSDDLMFVPCTTSVSGMPDFDVVKTASFGTLSERNSANSTNALNAKRLVYRYGLIVHNLLATFSSGCAELPGDDFVVSLGRASVIAGHAVGSTDQQAGTFMHEIGHALGLRHGGADNFNCKPNYLSVMSHAFQMNQLVADRPLDYSQTKLSPLDEEHLNETLGVGEHAALRTVYGPPPLKVTAANQPIDWNRDGDSADTSIARDINNFQRGTCDGAGGVGVSLRGHDDWSNLHYNFRTTSDFSDGAETGYPEDVPDELSFEDALEMSLDEDGDGVKNLIDNCALESNPDQLDSDDDGIGDGCEDFLTVDIDVKPGDFPNTINLKSNGVVPTAVLSSLSFDARTVLPESVSLSGATVKLTGKGTHYLCHEEDVNQDGLIDQFCHVNTAEFLLEEGESVVILEARTSEGHQIRGEDTIKVVP